MQVMARESKCGSRFIALVASGRWADFVEAIDVAHWKCTLRVLLR